MKSSEINDNAAGQGSFAVYNKQNREVNKRLVNNWHLSSNNFFVPILFCIAENKYLLTALAPIDEQPRVQNTIYTASVSKFYSVQEGILDIIYGFDRWEIHIFKLFFVLQTFICITENNFAHWWNTIVQNKIYFFSD